MAIMMEKLYDALRAANVPDDKARAAAVEAAHFDNRLNSIDGRLAKVEADLSALKWMVGFNLALTLGTLSGMIGLLLKLADRAVP